MSKKIIVAAAFFVLFIQSISYSQQHFSNKWNVYTCMKEVRGLGVSGTNVWAATSGGLFTFDYLNPSGSIRKFTSQDGLLSNDLTAGTIDNFGNVWAGGSDGSISVYHTGDGTWKLITDIQTSNETNKRIYGLFQYGNSMFISTEFSLIQFNIPLFQFTDQPYIFLGSLPTKTPVYKTIVINDTVWAATKNGIAYANINTALPIQSNWKNFTNSNSQLKSNQINSVVYFNSMIVFGTDSGLATYQNGSLSRYVPTYNGNPLTEPVYSLAVSNGSLFVSTYKTLNNTYRIDVNNLSVAVLVLPNEPVNVLEVSGAGDLFIGTANKGLNLVRGNTSTYILPNGPNSNIFATLEIDQNSNVWGSAGATNEGIYRLSGASWKNFTTDNSPYMGTGDYRHLYASKYSNTLWAGGYGNGLLKIVGDSLYRYTNSNSCLKAFEGNFCLVEGIKEDNSGALWLINRAAQYPIMKFSESPQVPCESYLPPTISDATTMLFMDIDNYNTKWMTFPNDVTGSPRGIAYFNESTNPKGLIINASSLGSNVNTVNHIVVEKNGEVWVATDNGIAVVRDPYQVISNPGSIPQNEKMRIIENGLSTPLLENVQCIGVDALNNKWIGTFSNGLIYVSPDGSTLLARYNMSNSPLPDNRIYCIVIDGRTGIAYFGTGKGMVSLQTIAVDPLESCDKIKVGPSPFIIPSSSLLKIDGLVAESTVKILTISGSLVYEFKTEGGRIANWDGRDFNGNLVSSGIYLVAGYNKDATKVCTGKIAVVRK